jgi:hypothetical protein
MGKNSPKPEMNSYPVGWRRMESRMKNWRSLHYYTGNILYTILLNWKYVHNVFTILLPNFQSLFKVNSPVLQYLASVSFLKEKSKICPKLTELLSWNGPTVHVWCFMLSRASTKTFVSRIHVRYLSPKNSEEIFVSRKIRSQSHSLAEVSLYFPSSDPRFSESRRILQTLTF